MHFYKGMSYEDVLALPIPAFMHLQRCADQISEEINKAHGNPTR